MLDQNTIKQIEDIGFKLCISNIDLWDANSLKLEAIHNYPQCRDMDFIIEMEENVEGDTHPWNMYLIKK